MKKLILLLLIIFIGCSKENSIEIEEKIELTNEEKIELIIDSEDSKIFISDDLQVSPSSCLGLLSFLFKTDVNEVVLVVSNSDCGISSTTGFNYNVVDDYIEVRKKSDDFLFGTITGLTINSFVFTSDNDRYLYERKTETK